MTRIHKSTLRSACSLVVLLGAGVAGLSAQSQSPSLFAANTIREALKEQGSLPKMTTTVRTSGEMRELILRHLDGRLLSRVRSISGRDFDYEFSDPGQTVRIGVVVLEYPTATVAKQMADVLAPQKNYFHYSMIFTRFSAVPLGRVLVITYSESSGHDQIAKVLDNLAFDFARASGNGATWGEPEMVNGTK
jgi:hypothetical protein